MICVAGEADRGGVGIGKAVRLIVERRYEILEPLEHREVFAGPDELDSAKSMAAGLIGFGMSACARDS